MIVAGTGHRPNKLGGYGKTTFARLHKLAYNWLWKHGCPCDAEGNRTSLTVISGMALGWDQALCAAALDFHEYMACSGDHGLVEIVAAIPFVGQEQMWPVEAQREYHRLLAGCDRIVHVCEPGYSSAAKMQRRNEWMVDQCDLLLALWDGTSGGTANCISYAEQSSSVEIINLWSEWENLSR